MPFVSLSHSLVLTAWILLSLLVCRWTANFTVASLYVYSIDLSTLPPSLRWRYTEGRKSNVRMSWTTLTQNRSCLAIEFPEFFHLESKWAHYVRKFTQGKCIWRNDSIFVREGTVFQMRHIFLNNYFKHSSQTLSTSWFSFSAIPKNLYDSHRPLWLWLSLIQVGDPLSSNSFLEQCGLSHIFFPSPPCRRASSRHLLVSRRDAANFLLDFSYCFRSSINRRCVIFSFTGAESW